MRWLDKLPSGVWFPSDNLIFFRKPKSRNNYERMWVIEHMTLTTGDIGGPLFRIRRVRWRRKPNANSRPLTFPGYDRSWQ